MQQPPYRDRIHAGQVLVEAVTRALGRPAGVLVLALPRGGVPVAHEVAEALGAELDLLLVRKLGVPAQPELAMGAIATGGSRVINEDVVTALDIPESVIEAAVRRERAELDHRHREYRGDRPLPHVVGRLVLAVDDGLATGASMRVAVAALRQQRPARIVVAVPVAPPETVRVLACEADQVICPATPSPFFGVGQWYENFDQTTDQEIREILDKAWRLPVSRRDSTNSTK